MINGCSSEEEVSHFNYVAVTNWTFGKPLGTNALKHLEMQLSTLWDFQKHLVLWFPLLQNLNTFKNLDFNTLQFITALSL